jgi:hypothetical protein
VTAAEEIARLQEQVLDLGEVVTGLTCQLVALRADLVTCRRVARKVGSVMAGGYVAEGLPVPPELAEFAPPEGPQLRLMKGSAR